MDNTHHTPRREGNSRPPTAADLMAAIKALEAKLDRRDRRLDRIESDVDAIDRRARPYGDGSRLNFLPRGWR